MRLLSFFSERIVWMLGVFYLTDVWTVKGAKVKEKNKIEFVLIFTYYLTKIMQNVLR